jgi:hypothetical protein
MASRRLLDEQETSVPCACVEGVDGNNVVTGVRQLVPDRAADESGSAREQNLHGSSYPGFMPSSEWAH